MNLSNWACLMAWFAAEMTVLVVVAAVFQVCFRSPRARRIVWQATFTSVALVWLVELSGMREKMPGLDLKQHHRFVLTTTVLPPSGLDANGDDRLAEIAPVSTPVLSVVKWPGWIWLAGAALLLARSLVARVWLSVRRRTAAKTDQDSLRLIAHLQISLGLRRVQSQVWAGLRGPVAFGVFHPTIALPVDFTVRFSSAEREAILAHEMAHLSAHDPFWMLMSDTVVALAWWHPLIWWARHKLQIASETAADEASALIPEGPCALAECLVRLGRELTTSGPARLLGVGGNGPQSQLAARIARLLREPRAWRPLSAWARWTPHLSAVFVALMSSILPIQTGLSGSILAVLAAAAPARAEVLSAATLSSAPITNQTAAPLMPASATKSAAIIPPTHLLASATSQPEVSATDTSTITQTRITPVIPVIRTDSQTTKASLRPKVSLQVQTVVITERDPDDKVGLDWIFGLSPTNNPTVQVSHDWKELQPFYDPLHASPDRHTDNRPRNVVVDRLRTEGQSAILKPEQFAALRDRILAATHDDILTMPGTVSDSGLQIHHSAQDLNTIVTGAEASDGSLTNSPSINYFTDNLATGFAVDIIPTVEDNDRWHLRVLARFITFLGYDKPINDKLAVSFPNGKRLKGITPLPHFRTAEASSDVTVPLGQILAIRGPLWTETTTETTKTKAYFFVSTKTKTLPKRLYVFVTLAPPPSESP